MRPHTGWTTATVAAATAWTLLVTTTNAQGYGRFPCSSKTLDNGSTTADQTLCSIDKLVTPGRATGNDMNNQGDGTNPVDAECVADTATGSYFCGIAGARCSSEANCDNGKCVDGVCTGGLGDECAGSDQACLGYLYCNAALFDKGTVCGGVGSFCQDYTQGSANFTDAQNFAVFNQFW
ncbi:hypothetical protein OIO90_000662 [Microbotryomycetes sp. JL221]|nr:hypothetical protein OIO90_000662 [Microbotryomycetes sp. JL221]